MVRITKKKVICPVCNKGRLMDINDNVQVEVIPEEKMPDDFNPQYFEKCCNCKSIIAIKIRSKLEAAVNEWVRDFIELTKKYNMQANEEVCN